MYCTTCGKLFGEYDVHCSSCGKARVPISVVDQSDNRGGTNVNAGRDVHIGDQNRWDGRAKSVMGRDREKPVWPIDLLSAVSAVVSILSFLGAGQIPKLTIPFAIVALVSVAVAFVSFAASGDLKSHGAHVLPLGLGTLERAKNGSTWLTEPVAECPWCPEHRPGTMRVARAEHGPRWICSNSPEHSEGFDAVQMPNLHADAEGVA